ncbi:peptidylprolyl isomerase [Candidatus Woesearchaeota archaeon]|nr:MAG: peptidylprolyl isomerase [Candidatus Woesearchaeota archaeon]
MVVKNGDKVKVEYKGTFDDGTVFDTSEGKAPLEFEVGKHLVIKGFEDALLGMDVNEEKEIVLQPAEAYGERKEELIKEVPREQLPQDVELKPGMALMANLPNGAQVPVMIKEVSDNTVTLDLNHPLAGKVLHFKIKLLEIKEN